MGSETDSWSDDNSIGEKDSRSWDAASSYDSIHEDFDDPTVRSKQGGYLNFQYSECDPPYERIPLADKVLLLLALNVDINYIHSNHGTSIFVPN